jgi:hypothetical protein
MLSVIYCACVREYPWFFCFDFPFFAVLRSEPMISHMLDKCSTSELHPQHPTFIRNVN